MKRPPLPWGAAGAEARNQNIQIQHSAFYPPLQLAAARRLVLLQHLRRDADSWRAAGARGRPPQPSAYGLRLGSLGSSEIYWP